MLDTLANDAAEASKRLLVSMRRCTGGSKFDLLAAHLMALAFAQQRGLLRAGALSSLESAAPGRDLAKAVDDRLQLAGRDQLPCTSGVPGLGGFFPSWRDACPPLDAEFKQALSAALSCDWGQVSDLTFGSALESVMQSESRHQRGVHYTKQSIIAQVLGPQIMDALESELEALLSLRPGSTARTAGLRAFVQSLPTLKFLDPACGAATSCCSHWMRCSAWSCGP